MQEPDWTQVATPGTGTCLPLPTPSLKRLEPHTGPLEARGETVRKLRTRKRNTPIGQPPARDANEAPGNGWLRMK
jgi:hypothetical protein